MTNKILFAGCSFTANSGFRTENIAKYHWPVLLSHHYNCNYNNIAIGGFNNDEIFLRSIERALDQNYQLVVVMWSQIGRRCVYYADNNIDDWTILNGNPTGLNYSNEELQTYSKLHYAYFNNLYVELKKWLIQIIALENVFANKNQNFVFVKGFENLLSDFIKVEYVANQLFSLSDNLKHLLDFENRPDYYILEKITDIKKLIRQIDTTKWINFSSPSFLDSALDRSDDQIHPGPTTNRLLVDKLIAHIDSHNLLNY